jgi:hypothetical protein
MNKNRLSLLDKSTRELFTIRFKRRENRKGVFNFCLRVKKMNNFKNDDLN